MPRFLPCLACLLVSLTAASSARADSFTYTFFGNGFSANGVLTGTADPFQANAFDVTAATLTLNGTDYPASVTSATDTADPGFNDGFTFDNVIYTSGATTLDQNGLLLSLENGALLADFSYNNGYQIALRSAGDPTDTTIYALANFQATQVAPTPTPEPSTLLFLGTGALLFSSLSRRKPAF